MLGVVLAVVTKVLLYVLILLVALWCWFQVTHWRILRAAAKIPTFLHPLPIIGHAHYTFTRFENMTQWILDTCEDNRDKGWSIFCYWCGPMPFITLLGAEDIQKVLNSSSTAEKSFEYDFSKFATGDGLLTSPWKVWKLTRRHINPLFHPRNLEHMIPAFNRNSEELVTILSEHVGGDPVNMLPHTMNTALKTVCYLIFGNGVDFNIKCEQFKGLRQVVERVPEVVMNRILRLWLRVDSIFNFIYKRELQELNKKWRTFTEDPLKTATLRHTEKVKSVDMSNELLVKQGISMDNNKDMLSLVDVYKIFQKNFPKFSDKDLEYEMVTLYTTGTDTVGLLTSSCLLALAYYPNIQERLVQEVVSVVGQDTDVSAQDILKMPYLDQERLVQEVVSVVGQDTDVSAQDLLKMPYLDQVYKETLRFFMIVPFIGRRTTEDITIGSHFIPAGSTLVLALEALNMDPKVFAKPKTFDPEHFSEGCLETREKYSFIPFSAGPRNCIGKRYAEIMTKIMVVNVLRKFKLSTTMDIYNLKKKLSVTLVCTEGYNVSLENRV